MAVPPALGDEKGTTYRLVREEHPIPDGGRPGLFAKIEELVNKGGVHRLLVQVGRGIVVSRHVKAKEHETEVLELPPDDLLFAALNNGMEEIACPPDAGALQLLIEAFAVIELRKLKPRKLYVASFDQLSKWVKVSRSLGSLFGIEVQPSKDMPEDAVLLVATGYDEWDLSTARGFRIPVDIEQPKDQLCPGCGKPMKSHPPGPPCTPKPLRPRKFA